MSALCAVCGLRWSVSKDGWLHLHPCKDGAYGRGQRAGGKK